MADAVPPADRLPLTATSASRIAGLGTHAGEPIAAGTAVLERAGTSPPDLAVVNHSCDPNLGWSGARTLVALRSIDADEELTVDYATCVDDPAFVLFCHCETYRCRQVVEGTDWRIPQLQRRYERHFAPHVLQRIDAAAAAGQ